MVHNKRKKKSDSGEDLEDESSLDCLESDQELLLELKPLVILLVMYQINFLIESIFGRIL